MQPTTTGPVGKPSCLSTSCVPWLWRPPTVGLSREEDMLKPVHWQNHYLDRSHVVCVPCFPTPPSGGASLILVVIHVQANLWTAEVSHVHPGNMQPHPKMFVTLVHLLETRVLVDPRAAPCHRSTCCHFVNSCIPRRTIRL